MTPIAGGFVLGIAASVHCVVMCGPLMMMALSGRRGRAAFLYHGGRLTVYALLGAFAGALGHLAGLAGFARLLSVVAGLALIWTAARRAGWVRAGGDLGVGRRVTNSLVNAARIMRARWRESSPLHLVSAGIVNGLLPCGPVYAALTASAALGDSTQSAAFMLAFGAGTLPALVAADTIASWTSRSSGGGQRWRLVTPIALAILGVLLTARGLIPTHHHHHAVPRPSPAPATHHAHPVVAQCENCPPSTSFTNLINPSK